MRAPLAPRPSPPPSPPHRASPRERADPEPPDPPAPRTSDFPPRHSLVFTDVAPTVTLRRVLWEFEGRYELQWDPKAMRGQCVFEDDKTFRAARDRLGALLVRCPPPAMAAGGALASS